MSSRNRNIAIAALLLGIIAAASLVFLIHGRGSDEEQATGGAGYAGDHYYFFINGHLPRNCFAVSAREGQDVFVIDSCIYCEDKGRI